MKASLFFATIILVVLTASCHEIHGTEHKNGGAGSMLSSAVQEDTEPVAAYSSSIVLPNGVPADVASSYYEQRDGKQAAFVVSVDTVHGALVTMSVCVDVPSEAAACDMTGITEDQWQSVLMDAMLHVIRMED